MWHVLFVTSFILATCGAFRFSPHHYSRTWTSLFRLIHTYFINGEKNKQISVWHSIFIAGSRMSSVPATFKVCRARQHQKLILLTFGRNIYSFNSLSTWFYLWFSHLGVYDTCFIPFVFSPWYSPGKLDSPTRWPPGPPWMTKSLWVSPRMHGNTHMHAHIHRHTARNANICINYKMENWKWLLPKGVKVYCCGFLIIILTCCH